MELARREVVAHQAGVEVPNEALFAGISAARGDRRGRPSDAGRLDARGLGSLGLRPGSHGRHEHQRGGHCAGCQRHPSHTFRGHGLSRLHGELLRAGQLAPVSSVAVMQCDVYRDFVWRSSQEACNHGR